MWKNCESKYLDGRMIAFSNNNNNNNKKIGERFHPTFPTTTNEEYPMEFAPDLITLVHPEQEIKHEY